MTCCIAYKTNEKIYFAADSAGTDEDGVQETRSDPKIFKIDNVLFATDSSFRMRDVLMYNLILPRKSRNETIDKYVRSKLISVIRNLLIDNGVCTKTDDCDQNCPGNILIGIKDKIYKIESDFQVGEVIRPYNAIGSGSREALAALDMYMLCKKPSCILNEFEIKDMFEKTFAIVANRNSDVNNCIRRLEIEIK